MTVLRRWKRLAVAAVAVAGLAALAVAGSATARTGRSAAGETLFMLPKFTGIPPFTQADQGANSLAKGYGYTLKYGGPTTGSATQQVNFINNAAAAGDKGLFISADNPSAVSPALTRARARGLKVVSFDSDVEPSARTIYVQGTGATSIAETELNMLGSQIGYKGSFAILSAQATDANQVLWNKQLKQDLKKDPKYKNMKLVAIVNPPDDGTPSAVKYTQSIIQKYPTIKGIIAPTTVAVAAAAQVVKQQHLCSKYVVTGLGDPQQMKPFVTSGCIKQFALWNFQREGEVAMCAMHYVLAGSLTGKTGQSFSCPKGLGKFTVAAQGTVTAGPAEVFTNKNLSAYTF
ncbi:MAG TPA: substrate-binding domain-containing protein [Solirubrobacteraceae bacterium]|jgi:rhamnose transport system substrate-binding protein|nr:substrate-binding domain-containing protein [Solirubrobacteraceae bacterium]